MMSMQKPTIRWIPALFVAALSLMVSGTCDAADEPKAASPAGNTSILNIKSLWRYKMVRGTEAVRLESGEVVSVHPYRVMRRVGKGKDRRYEIGKHKASLWTALPADGWQQPDFDDGTWALLRGPFCIAPGYKYGESIYRSVPMLCLRGKFEVKDPATAGDLTLSIEYLGGVAVFLNGKELARQHLPKGELEPMTLAEDYPKEAFVDAEGVPLHKKSAWTGRGKDLKFKYTNRLRNMSDFKVPAAALRKGVNVLALQLHRAPFAADYFLSKGGAKVRKSYFMEGYGWPRVGVKSVELQSADGASAVANVGHAGRPKGLQIWNQPIEQDVKPYTYGDPNEPLRPVRISGARNGHFSGQLVVGSPEAIKGLKATCTELKGKAGSIPSSQVRVRYAELQVGRRTQFLGLSDSPPAEVPALKAGKYVRYPESRLGAVQPVWFTVHVPADAKPGDYTGTISVSVSGQDPVKVPVELRVADWTLPDAIDFVCAVGLFQSPDTLALKYKVKMWSEEHWKLIERSFQKMGEIGCKEVYLTPIRRTHIGNEHGIIRFKHDNGKLIPDFSIADRYLDVAAKHLGRPLKVCLYCWEHTGTGHFPSGLTEEKRMKFERDILISIVGEGGALEKAKGPAWGTPACREFWKPICDGIKDRMKKRGIEGEMMLGIAGDYVPSATAVGDLNAASGNARWVRQTHSSSWSIGTKAAKVGYLVSAWGGARPQLPDFGRCYGWASPDCKAVTREFPRAAAYQRLYIEAKATSSARFVDRKSYGLRGPARMGADFWPVEGLGITKEQMGKSKIRSAVLVAGRYPETAWGQLNIVLFMPAMFASGPKGAIHCTHTERFRENIQEMEARIFLEKALLDPEKKAKLGDDFATRAQSFLDNRTRVAQCTVMQYMNDYTGTLACDVPGMSRKLYKITAEATAKLGAGK